MTRKSLFALAWLGALSCAPVAAQSAIGQPATRTPDAPDPRLGPATTTYRSVFDQYVPAMDDKPLAWRDANALVGSIGGWRVYAREAQPSAPAGTTQPSAPSITAPQQTAPANAAPPAAAGTPTPHQKH